MNFSIPHHFLGELSLWDEDVKWLAEHRAWAALGHLSPRLRWVHFYLEYSGIDDRIRARIQLDMAGHHLIHATGEGSCAQAAICEAFKDMNHHLYQEEMMAG
jgi:hypothetical protein